jgi:hypothetical protein
MRLSLFSLSPSLSLSLSVMDIKELHKLIVYIGLEKMSQG